MQQDRRLILSEEAGAARDLRYAEEVSKMLVKEDKVAQRIRDILIEELKLDADDFDEAH